jgi:phage protein D
MANVDNLSPTLAKRRPGRMRAICQIFIAGKEVTSVFDPYLIKVTVKQGAGIGTASIELDDRYGILKLPEGNDAIIIRLGWPDEGSLVVFKGTVTDLVSAAQKKSGRRLHIEAQALDIFQEGKEPRNDTFLGKGEDEGVTLKEALEAANKKLREPFNLQIDEKIGGSKLPPVVQTESFMALANRLARETGGILHIDGKDVSILAEGTVNSKATIIAEVGKNVLAWRIVPLAGRPQWDKVSSHWFDPKKSGWFKAFQDVKRGALSFGSGGKAIFDSPWAAGNQSQAEVKSFAEAATSVANRGTGWIVIDGEPRAQANAGVEIRKARAGVDDTYKITQLEHEYNRGGGFTTRLDVNNPGVTPNLGADDF